MLRLVSTVLVSVYRYFNLEVLKLVNRTPSELPMEDIMQILRSSGASINMDFLFGLPLQTADSFQHTIEKGCRITSRSRYNVQLWSLPWIFKRQMILEKAGLPSADEKALMFQRAKEVLHAARLSECRTRPFCSPQVMSWREAVTDTYVCIVTSKDIAPDVQRGRYMPLV